MSQLKIEASNVSFIKQLIYIIILSGFLTSCKFDDFIIDMYVCITCREIVFLSYPVPIIDKRFLISYFFLMAQLFFFAKLNIAITKDLFFFLLVNIFDKSNPSPPLFLLICFRHHCIGTNTVIIFTVM